MEVVVLIKRTYENGPWTSQVIGVYSSEEKALEAVGDTDEDTEYYIDTMEVQ